jgi:DNA polymerase V
MSSRMMALAAEFAPRQEIYSIDECFLDFDGVPVDRLAIGRDLRRRVLQWTGLPTSVGFGATKTLAKLANHVAKSADRGKGGYPALHAQVCDFGSLSPNELDELMRLTDVGDLWGVGRKTAPRLRQAGVCNALDLRRADAAALGRQFSVVMKKTVLELQGTRCLEVEDAPAPQQQILCSRSFGQPVTELPDLVEVVSGFASRVAQRLREQQAAARAVQVFICTSPHRRQDRQHAPVATLPLRHPSADTRVLVQAAVRALQGIYRPGHRYAKAGVMLLDLQSEVEAQAQSTLDLFAEAPTPGQPDGRRDLMQTKIGRAHV